jgi:hypothetical protein
MDNSNFIKLADIKAFILEKKILLNMINEEYNLYDSIIKVIHLIVAMIQPVISLIDLLLGQCTDGLVAVVFGIGVVIIMKLREIFNYKKLQEQSKEQSVKYRQLFNMITEEEDKAEYRRQPKDIFVYWIVREYNNIQLNDPEIPKRTNQKFNKLCKEHNITWNADINILEKLLHDINSPIHSPVHSPIHSTINSPIHSPIHSTINSPIHHNTQSPRNLIIVSNECDKMRVRRLSHMLEKSEHEYKTLTSNDNFKDDTEWTLTRLKSL